MVSSSYWSTTSELGELRSLLAICLTDCTLTEPVHIISPFFSWSFLTSSQTVSLVPFRHDEYPRFISGAYPFYASTLSTVAAFGLFCFLWLAIGGAESEKKKGEVRVEKVKA